MTTQVCVDELDLRRTADRRRFTGLPFQLAKSHSAWHPGLRLFSGDLLHPRRNPFWRTRVASFFVVLKDGRVVGRAGVIAPGEIPQRPMAATLVMPDFINDAALAGALLNAVLDRARHYGATEVIGPLNPDIHHDVGIQISGFEQRNAVFMGYQPSYYARHFEAYGFTRLLDFQAWNLDRDRSINDRRLTDLARRVERGGRLRIRNADPRRFDEELVHFHHLYSASFADHWGFTAPSWEEFRFIASDMRYLVREGMALIAEWDGVPVGFVLSVPDLYAILPKQPQGRLTPLVLARTLWRWRGVADARIMIAGVLPGYRHLGIHLPLFYRLRSNLFGLGFRRGEISWVLQGNRALARALKLLGARPAKTYRVYAMSLA